MDVMQNPIQRIETALSQASELAAQAIDLVEQLIGAFPETEGERFRLAGCGGAIGRTVEQADDAAEIIFRAKREIERAKDTIGMSQSSLNSAVRSINRIG